MDFAKKANAFEFLSTRLCFQKFIHKTSAIFPLWTRWILWIPLPAIPITKATLPPTNHTSSNSLSPIWMVPCPLPLAQMEPFRLGMDPMAVEMVPIRVTRPCSIIPHPTTNRTVRQIACLHNSKSMGEAIFGDLHELAFLLVFWMKPWIFLTNSRLRSLLLIWISGFIHSNFTFSSHLPALQFPHYFRCNLAYNSTCFRSLALTIEISAVDKTRTYCGWISNSNNPYSFQLPSATANGLPELRSSRLHRQGIRLQLQQVRERGNAWNWMTPSQSSLKEEWFDKNLKDQI